MLLIKCQVTMVGDVAADIKSPSVRAENCTVLVG